MTLRRVFDELHAHRVQLEGILLKPNMVLSGKDCAQQAGVEDVATATLDCFRRTVPAARCRASSFSPAARAPYGPPSTSTP